MIFIKYILRLSTLLILTHSLAQDSKVSTVYTVRDFHSNKEIDNVHVRNMDNVIVAYTDEYGRFHLPDTLISGNKIKLSCVGYEILDIDLSDLRTNEIKMFEKTVFLDEVVVKPMSARQLVAKCIANVKENYLSEQIRSKGRLLVRSLPLIETHCELELKVNKNGRYDLLEATCPQVTDTLKSEIIGLANNAFDFDHVINGRGFLNLQNVDSWEFEFLKEVYYNGDTLRVVSAKYIVGTDRKAEVEHRGIVFINEEDYSIPKIEYHYRWMQVAPKKSDILGLWFRDRKWIGHAYYGKRNGQYEIINLKYDLLRNYYKNPSTVKAIESKNFTIEYRSKFN